MPHFFVNSKNIDNKIAVINDLENYRHIAKSLRAKTGERLLLIDENQIQYETVISSISKDSIICNVEKSYFSERDLDFDLYLAQVPLRSDAQSTIIEKATELGVRGIYPIITDNCAVKKEIAENKVEKWQRIMYEASKQCERAKIPSCFPVNSLENVLNKEFDRVVVLGERSTEQSLKSYLTNHPIVKKEKFLTIIGPEGGFSDREFSLFKEKKLPIISLGNLILKAETAVIVSIGDIIYEYQG